MATVCIGMSLAPDPKHRLLRAGLKAWSMLVFLIFQAWIMAGLWVQQLASISARRPFTPDEQTLRMPWKADWIIRRLRPAEAELVRFVGDSGFVVLTVLAITAAVTTTLFPEFHRPRSDVGLPPPLPALLGWGTVYIGAVLAMIWAPGWFIAWRTADLAGR